MSRDAGPLELRCGRHGGGPGRLCPRSRRATIASSPSAARERPAARPRRPPRSNTGRCTGRSPRRALSRRGGRAPPRRRPPRRRATPRGSPRSPRGRVVATRTGTQSATRTPTARAWLVPPGREDERVRLFSARRSRSVVGVHDARAVHLRSPAGARAASKPTAVSEPAHVLRHALRLVARAEVQRRERPLAHAAGARRESVRKSRAAEVLARPEDRRSEQGRHGHGSSREP